MEKAAVLSSLCSNPPLQTACTVNIALFVPGRRRQRHPDFIVGQDNEHWQTTATVSITKLPKLGILYQISRIFDTHGYEPKAGSLITEVPPAVTGKTSRVVYRQTPQMFDYAGERRDSDEFEYIVNDSKDGSIPARVTIVSSDRQLVSSEFRFTNEGWSIVGKLFQMSSMRPLKKDQ
jgi:hypothetical protein